MHGILKYIYNITTKCALPLARVKCLWRCFQFKEAKNFPPSLNQKKQLLEFERDPECADFLPDPPAILCMFFIGFSPHSLTYESDPDAMVSSTDPNIHPRISSILSADPCPNLAPDATHCAGCMVMRWRLELASIAGVSVGVSRWRLWWRLGLCLLLASLVAILAGVSM